MKKPCLLISNCRDTALKGGVGEILHICVVDENNQGQAWFIAEHERPGYGFCALKRYELN
jgi:hypothetical protein